MRAIIILFIWGFILGYAVIAKGQGTHFLAGGRSLGLAHSTVVLSSHWGTFHNQAGLADVQDFSVGLFAERKFGIESLNSGAISIALPVEGLGTFGASLYQFANGRYFYQQRYGLAYSRKFGKKVSAGVQFDAVNVFFREFGNMWQVLGEAGIQFKPVEKLKLGVHVYNPTATEWKQPSGERLPTVFRAGAGYQFTEKFLWLAELEKNTIWDLRFKSGIEYKPIEALSIQGGVATQPVNYSIGIGYRWNWLKVNAAFLFHQRLGGTPGLEANYLKSDSPGF